MLRTQNDKPFCHCGAGVRWTPLRSRSTDRAGRRDRRKTCGNLFSPFLVIAKPCKRLWQSVFLLRVLRILSCFALRMTRRLVAANTVECTENRRPVIAVRVSGGHHCEAEAPTEPASETAVRCAAIRFLPFSSLRSRVNGCGNPFFPRVLRILSCFALRMTNRFVIAVRVSGGHLCEAEAPSEPAGETTARCAAIRSLLSK